LNEQSPKPFQSCRPLYGNHAKCFVMSSSSSLHPSRDRGKLRSPRLEPLSSFGFLGISTDLVQQRSRRFRNSNFAVQNFMAVYIVAVHGFVSTFVGLHDSAVQADPSENAFGARIRQNLRIQFKVGTRGGVPAHWSGCYRGVGSELEFVAEQALQGAIVHKEQHDVGGRAPNLVTHAPSVNSQKHGSAPAMPGPTGCQSPAVVAAEDEGELHVPWN